MQHYFHDKGNSNNRKFKLNLTQLKNEAKTTSMTTIRRHTTEMNAIGVKNIESAEQVKWLSQKSKGDVIQSR